MLAPMHGDGPFLGNTGSDAVRPLDRLGPDPTEPRPPIFESVRLCLLAAVFDHDTRSVAE